jgi:hypothetical protein
LLSLARHRAKKKSLPFNITVDDVPIPEVCPILGIRMFRNSGGKRQGPHSPSIDRKDPALGYIPGNVWIISAKANEMKGAMTLAEFQRWSRMLCH